VARRGAAAGDLLAASGGLAFEGDGDGAGVAREAGGIERGLALGGASLDSRRVAADLDRDIGGRQSVGEPDDRDDIAGAAGRRSAAALAPDGAAVVADRLARGAVPGHCALAVGESHVRVALLVGLGEVWEDEPEAGVVEAADVFRSTLDDLGCNDRVEIAGLAIVVPCFIVSDILSS
jgi:hypothetical protein